VVVKGFELGWREAADAGVTSDGVVEALMATVGTPVEALAVKV
jgi:hypothetical protein